MSVSGLYPVNGNDSGVFYNGLYVVAGTVQVPEGSIDPRAIAGAVSGSVFVDLQSAQVINGSKTFTQRIYAVTIQISSGAQAGYFLTCDTFGNASWVPLDLSGYVDLVSTQTIGGLKTFTQKVSVASLLVSVGAQAGYVFTSDASGNGTWQAPAVGAYVDLISNQNVAGIKTFSSPIVSSGAGLTTGTIPAAAVVGGAIVSTGPQTIAGLKTFSQGPNMPGTNIIAGSISQLAIAGGALIIFNNPNNGNNQGLNGGWAINNYLQANQIMRSFLPPTSWVSPLLTLDYSTSGIFYFSGGSGSNFTANIINIPAVMVTNTASKMITVTIVMTSNRGYANVVQIGGTTIPVQFVGGPQNIQTLSAVVMVQTIDIYFTSAYPTPDYAVSKVEVSYSTANSNVYLGNQSGQQTNIGTNNVCLGYQAGTGMYNTNGHIVIGALAGNAMGGNSFQNVVIGYSAGGQTTSNCNIIIGAGAIVTTGGAGFNVVIGTSSGQGNGTLNTILGTNANVTGSNSNATVCGSYANANFNRAAAFGANAAATAANEMMIGTNTEFVHFPGTSTNGSVIMDGAEFRNMQQTNIAGSTTGSIYVSQIERGSAFKKVVVYVAALTGTASYTFPVAFTFTPAIIVDANPTGIPASAVTSLSATGFTITSAGSSGNIFFEGI